MLPVGFRRLDHPCIAVPAEGVLLGATAARTNDASDGDLQFGLMLELYSGPDCSGVSLGTQLVTGTEGGTGGLWDSIPGGTAAIPSGAASGRPSLFFDAGTSTPSEVLLDRVLLVPALFADGFESGDTSAWTSTAP